METGSIGDGRVQDAKVPLVIYLSRTGNTKALAEIIHKRVGGELQTLELVDPYPEDYRAIVAQVAQENESGFLPELKTRLDLEKYDPVFIGFPTWGMQLPPPIKSFLAQSDLSGKTVVPFNTNAGHGVGSSFKTLRRLSPGSRFLEGFSVKGGIERDGVLLVIKGEQKERVGLMVDRWLEGIQMPEKK